jgi:hypothetical protein
MSNPALEGSHPELESPLKTMESSGDMRDSDYKISESKHEPRSPPKRNDTNNKTGGMRVVVSETKMKATSAPKCKDTDEICKHEHLKHDEMVRGKTSERPATELADEINKLTNDISHDKFELAFCPYRCGKIARFIIAAWAHQMQIIVWDEKKEDNSKERERGRW